MERANAVPTRQAANDCRVRLAGIETADRPDNRDFASTTTHKVIHAQATQAIKTAARTTQWLTVTGS